jgi:predicted DNA-binding transcriptional regulator AlpA
MSSLPIAKRLARVEADKATNLIITIPFHGGNTHMGRNFDHMILTSTPSQAHLAVVDGALLTVAGWLRELERAVVSCGDGMTHMIPVEYLRRSRLGQDLLLVVCYLEDERTSDSRVEEAMERVYRVLFSSGLGDGYSVPWHFHRSALGQLFHQAYVKLYGCENLLTPAQVYHELGIARQTLYDRVKKGKLRLISFYGETRFLRSEVEAWKAQRTQRKQVLSN